MRFKIFTLIAFVAALSIVSCGKKNTGTDAPPAVDPPIVTLSKTTIQADGFEETVITVKDKNGNDVTSQAILSAAGIGLAGNTFSATTAGSYTIQAKLGAAQSAGVVVTATAPVVRHTKKVIAEDYTGAWCGYCPRIAKSLDDLVANTGGKVIPIAIHNGDGLVYSLEAQMRAKWGITGFPTAVVERKFTWNENASQVSNETSKWAAVGLGIESTVAGSTVTGKVKAQFNITTSNRPLNMVIMLIEDGKVLAQANYYNTTAGSPFFGLGNPIQNYVHNHTLRAAFGSVFGDAIPAASVVRDNVFERTFTFNGTGYDLSKCYVVTSVTFADGQTNTGSLNAQIAKVGTTVNY